MDRLSLGAFGLTRKDSTDSERLEIRSQTDIFVFGSNRLGRHGKGAALAAVQKWGAKYGQGEGLQGRSYAIPTKSTPYESLSLTEIQGHVESFREFAVKHPEHRFLLTAIGTGYAGHKVQGVAPLFKDMPTNVMLPQVFMRYLDGSSDAWDKDYRG